MLNEWNTTPGKPMLGSSEACANTAAMMCSMQNKKTNILCYYDARMRAGAFGGMFNPVTEQAVSTYYPFMAFGEMLLLKNQSECTFSEEGLYAVAAANGAKHMAMISNISGNELNIKTNLDDSMRVYLIDCNNFYKLSELNASDFNLKSYQVAVIKNFK